jgi:hypothetical protein
MKLFTWYLTSSGGPFFIYERSKYEGSTFVKAIMFNNDRWGGAEEAEDTATKKYKLAKNKIAIETSIKRDFFIKMFEDIKSLERW